MMRRQNEANNICTVYSFPQISETILLVIVYVALHSSLSLVADIKINFILKLAFFLTTSCFPRSGTINKEVLLNGSLFLYCLNDQLSTLYFSLLQKIDVVPKTAVILERTSTSQDIKPPALYTDQQIDSCAWTNHH